MTRPEKTAAWLGVLLLASYVAWRLSWLASVMTHVDDMGPVVDLILRSENAWPRRVLGAWRQWSYAPTQYFLMDLLLRFASEPQALVFAGRMAAFLAWMGGWALLAWILLRPQAAGWAEWPLAVCALPLAWILLSWRGIIESSQAYTYAATLAVAVVLCWAACSEFAERLSRTVKGGALLGAILAVSVSVSYQAIFLGAAAWTAVALEALRRRERRALAPLLLAGLLFAVAAMVFYAAHLKAYAALARFPSWASSGYPPAELGLAAAIEFLVCAWPAVLQNLTSIGPWGLPGNFIGVLALAAGLAGLAVGATRGALIPVERRLAMFAGLLALIWSAGALSGRFPLSPTRHTYVLQVPFLLLVASGVRHLPVAQAVTWAASALLAAVWAWHVPLLWRSIQNHVDLVRVEAAIDAHPAAAIASAPGDYSWDHMLLWRSRPDLRGRLYREEFPDLLMGRPRQFDELLLVSHRGALSPATREALAHAGYTELRSLAAVPPTGSTELAGNPNGGNGFFLTLCRREATRQAAK